ncbi:bacillithiol biosynthesis cysteine-adding enzyme BshC [Thermoactinomyces sp. DSM 45892]|uniref:bacillithiol biosynthesis cysteine-adding enzyme BshC n=1 Tax=Thermoactinomyces sp. DSM 45892 TaxID=1882753 RepID=UPI00089BD989|nr:bacillithiol biosynthesis cysteine-adding enzyme BshC [Thermoactinomyces sp. DSM 45892]SDY61090.1 bacillithiol biosynthesis cysteine-adding enzyme BshC [Thermoactinomyces sp. DSM 45892]
MKIECIKNPWQNQLMNDYLELEHPVHSFFSHHPLKSSSYPVRAQEVFASLSQRVDREKLVEVLYNYHQPELLHPEIESNLERLRQEDSLVVIGGQQAGLLTGPLYTIHKVFTIIELARKQEQELGKPVIPVFWIAGEDHDLDEVNHIWIQRKEGILKKRYRVEVEKNNREAVSHLTIDPEDLQNWLQEISEHYVDTPYKTEWLEACLALAHDKPSWGRFFARLLHSLFAKYGLVLIDSADPRVRQIERDFFLRLIHQSKQIQASIQKSVQQFQEAGYADPIHTQPNQANLFLITDNERVLLDREGDQWVTRGGKQTFTTPEICHIAQHTPERFSNNVATRPLMQEYLFPVLAFVAGPGEVAYWGVLKEAFTHTGLSMPIVYPRFQMTLVERHVDTRKREFGHSWETYLTEGTLIREEWLKAQFTLQIDPLFDAMKKQVVDLYQPMIKQIHSQLGRQTEEMGQKNIEKVTEQIQFYQRFVERTMSDIHQTTLRQWDELLQGISPNEQPQERVYNLIYYWNAYGLDWIDRVLQLLRDKQPTHHFMVHF